MLSATVVHSNRKDRKESGQVAGRKGAFRMGAVWWMVLGAMVRQNRSHLGRLRSLPTQDSVGDEGEPDKVECQQNGQDLPD
jgi:hypothetical protein